jgi:hypothetical protein
MIQITDTLKRLTALFLRVAETGLALVAVLLVLYLLLGGESGSFVLSVVANVGHLVDAISAQAIVTLALIIAVIALIRGRG